MTKNRYGIYGYFDIGSGDCIYIGITRDINSNERHRNHLKPSKIDRQPVNKYLQNNKNWEYIILWNPDYPEFISEKNKKKNIHNMEMIMISQFKPFLNKYGNSSS